jgi:hypothetical protein
VHQDPVSLSSKSSTPSFVTVAESSVVSGSV